MTTNTKSKASSLAVERMMQFIHRQEIVPGTILYEQDMASRLGISRTPVRQAFDRMVADGVFERVPDKRGVFFPPLTPADFLQVISFRESLEAQAASILARRNDAADIGALEESYERQIAFHSSEGDYETYDYINSGFHMKIAELCGNGYLIRALKQVFWRFRLYDFYLGGFRNRDAEQLVIDERSVAISNRGHRDIVDAIIAGDPQRAAEAAIEHIRQSVDTGGYAG